MYTEEEFIKRMLPVIGAKAWTVAHNPQMYDDLVQEGMCGVLRAFRRYDPERQASPERFATVCAENNMYAAMRKTIRHSKNVEMTEEVPIADFAERTVFTLWLHNVRLHNVTRIVLWYILNTRYHTPRQLAKATGYPLSRIIEALTELREAYTI